MRNGLIAALILSMLAIAGCGGAGSGGAGGDLKIGLLLPYSGVYASLGESMTNGMQLYFDEVGGKAGGRKIVLIKEDTEAKNDVGLRKARKLVEQDQADVIAGVVSSGVLMAIRDFVHESQVPLVVANAGADAVTRERKSPYIFRVSYSNWQVAAAQGEWAAKNLGKRAVTLNPDYAAGKDNVKAFRETFEPAGGQIVKEVYFPLGNSDFGPFLTQVKAENPEVVYAFAAGSDAVRLVNAWKDFGMTVPLIANGFLVEEDILPQVKEKALGIYSGLNWAYGLENAENKKFIQAYEKKYGKTPDVYAAQAYETAQFIVAALGQVKGNTSDKAALLNAMKAVTFKGPRGEFKLDPDTQNVIPTMYIRRVAKVGDRITNTVIHSIPNFKDPGVTR